MNLMWTLPIGVFWRLFNSEMSPSTVEESSYKGPPTLLLSSSPSLPVLSFCACCEHHRLLLPSALCKPVFPCLLSVVFFCPENCCASLGLGSCVVLPGGSSLAPPLLVQVPPSSLTVATAPFITLTYITVVSVCVSFLHESRSSKELPVFST